MELLLEAYLMEVDSLLVKVKHARHNLEAVERCVAWCSRSGDDHGHHRVHP